MLDTPIHEWQRGEFLVSTDRARLRPAVVHGFLSSSYWSAQIPLAVVERAIAGSWCFGLHHGDAQVGFARVVTDGATFAWVCDVFVLEPERGKGLAQWLVECARATPELQGLRRWLLATRDAHGLYARSGFVPLAAPERWMEISDLELYRRPENSAGRTNPPRRRSVDGRLCPFSCTTSSTPSTTSPSLNVRCMGALVPTPGQPARSSARPIGHPTSSNEPSGRTAAV